MASFSLDDLDDVLGDLNETLAGLDDALTPGVAATESFDQQLMMAGMPKREPTVIEFQPVSAKPEVDNSELGGLLSDLSSVKGMGKVDLTRRDAGPSTDDILSQLTAATDDLATIDPDEAAKLKEKKIQEAMLRLQEANIKKLTIRVYINDPSNFKTLNITSLQSSEQVIVETLEKAHLEAHPDWTLFEVVLDHGIERPIRAHEKITDIIWTWERETTNCIMMRKYPEKRALNLVRTTQEFPRMSGVMYVEVKKGKWQKRYFELKFSGIYHYKDTKLSQETFLCNWADYDVYSVFVERKKAPSKFCFSLRLQSRAPPHAEDEFDYVKFLCVESQAALDEWVTAIRNAKNRKFLEDNPDYVPEAALKVSAEREVLARLQESVGKDKKVFKEDQETQVKVGAPQLKPQDYAATAGNAAAPAPSGAQLTRSASIGALPKQPEPVPESAPPAMLQRAQSVRAAPIQEAVPQSAPPTALPAVPVPAPKPQRMSMGPIEVPDLGAPLSQPPPAPAPKPQRMSMGPIEVPDLGAPLSQPPPVRVLPPGAVPLPGAAPLTALPAQPVAPVTAPRPAAPTAAGLPALPPLPTASNRGSIAMEVPLPLPTTAPPKPAMTVSSLPPLPGSTAATAGGVAAAPALATKPTLPPMPGAAPSAMPTFSSLPPLPGTSLAAAPQSALPPLPGTSPAAAPQSFLPPLPGTSPSAAPQPALPPLPSVPVATPPVAATPVAAPPVAVKPKPPVPAPGLEQPVALAPVALAPAAAPVAGGPPPVARKPVMPPPSAGAGSGATDELAERMRRIAARNIVE